jgi:hypothetical protein
LKKKQRVGECGSAFKIACFLKEANKVLGDARKKIQNAQ